MNKRIKAISLIMMILVSTGCSKNNLVKENQEITKESINKNQEAIISNDISKTNDEIIKIIESTNSNSIKVTKEERYELREKIYSELGEEYTSEFISKINSSLEDLTNTLVDDRYKELFDKNNNRWDAYDENGLYGVAKYMNYLEGNIDNKELKNDLKRVEMLCSYGLSNRDVVAIIDARRILRDISYHLMSVPYFKEEDEVVYIDEDDYKIYYGASEVLERSNYKLIGEYEYSF